MMMPIGPAESGSMGQFSLVQKWGPESFQTFGTSPSGLATLKAPRPRNKRTVIISIIFGRRWFPLATVHVLP